MKKIIVITLVLGLHVACIKKSSESEIKTAYKIENKDFAKINNTDDSLLVCSFNIKFLGSSKSRKNAELSKLVNPCDMLVVQELVAAPIQIGKIKPDVEVIEFINEMKNNNFDYIISEGKT